MLYVAAHPDDENTNLLTYLANGRGVRTGYLSITRGDGGQNLIGSGAGGRARAHPHPGAAGGPPHRRRRAVVHPRARLRLLEDRRGDAAHLGRGRGAGRRRAGHPAGSARRDHHPLFPERWRPRPPHRLGDAGGAGLPGRGRPEVPAGLDADAAPWQARRLFVEPRRRRRAAATAALTRLDVGEYDALLGASYGEIAAYSRSMHKSQGFGVARRRGPIVEYFQLLDRGRRNAGQRQRRRAGEAARSTASTSPGAGSPGGGAAWPSWPPTGARVPVRRSRRASVPALLALDAALEGVSDAVLARPQARARLRELVAACAGLWSRPNAASPRGPRRRGAGRASPRSTDRPSRSSSARSDSSGPALAGRDARAGRSRQAAAPGTSRSGSTLEVAAAAEASASAPYWLREPPQPARYQVADATQIGLPGEPARAVRRGPRWRWRGGASPFVYPVVHKWTDPVAGERIRPLEVVPAVSVDPLTGVLLFPGGKSQPLRVRLTAAHRQTGGRCGWRLPAGFWPSRPAPPSASAAAGDEVELAFTVRPPRRARRDLDRRCARWPRSAVGKLSQRRAVRSSTPTSRSRCTSRPRRSALSAVDLRLPARGSATSPGPATRSRASLARVGYTVVVLDDAALGTGARSAASTPSSSACAPSTPTSGCVPPRRLMDYVQAGGTLVVQYNTNNRLGDLDELMGPWSSRSAATGSPTRRPR